MILLYNNIMEIKVLTKDYLKEIRDLENKELDKNNPNNHYTYDDDDFFYNSIFNNNGVIFGVFVNNTLVAFSGNHIVCQYECEYFMSKLKERGINTECSKVVFFNNTLVAKDFRGKGLQKKLRETTIEYYKNKGINEFITTTTKENIPSAKNLIKLGMNELKPLNDTPYSDKLKRFFYLKSK